MVTYNYDWRTGQLYADGTLVSDKDTFYEQWQQSTGGGGGGGAGGGGTGGGGTGGTGTNVDMTDDELSAYQLFANVLASWGIPMGADIAAIIKAAVIDGITPDQIELIIPDIQNTQTWKTRFPGWHLRVSNGYNQISVGEYLALESTYHRILQAAGLPSGFYDDPSDFGAWIANNVSPDEIQGRVDSAMSLVRQVDPTARNMLAMFYGVGAGDIAAYFLDSQRALPTLLRQFEAVNIATWAWRNGMRNSDPRHFEDLVDKGVSTEMAAAGYSTISRFARTLGNTAQIYGQTYDATDAENDVFFNDDEKRLKFNALEQAQFGGSSGFNPGVKQRGRPTAGSY